MNLRLPHALALALAVGTACTPDPDPLPGYVPDPDEYTVPAEVAKVRDVPDAPGLQAPVDHLLLVLAPDAGREVAEAIATSEGGTIVGQIPALRFYQLKLPTETMDALFAAIDRAASSSASKPRARSGRPIPAAAPPRATSTASPPQTCAARGSPPTTAPR
ncbi:MAG: hypothetical protein R3B99_33430 [Polyangiales bacterium]